MDHINNGQNGNSVVNGFHEATLEDMERELPVVHDGQIPLGELVSRVVQSIYAELSEHAETMPNMSDSARKRMLADWVVKTKKQVVKLYALVKWARDADTVQKAMNVTAFLMDQNKQFEEAIHGLKYAKESLDPARLRNHDLLTSLDVLTTGSYRRLPTGIKKLVIPSTPLTDAEVDKTLSRIEDTIRFRLKMMEIIPPEMSQFRIAEGRVTFIVPQLFQVVLSLRGAQKDDGWFFVNVEFLFTIGGDRTGMQDFPRQPVGLLKQHITDEADGRLAFYLPIPEELMPPPDLGIPPRPQLPQGIADAPLVRVFNFLQMMSLSYQLEILWYQAERMRSLGWADYLTVEMTNNRRTLTITYWIRKPPTITPGRQLANKFKVPLLGGKLSIAIVQVPSTVKPPNKPLRSPKVRVLAELQERSKIGTNKPSDEVEGMRFDVNWEPQQGALGVNFLPDAVTLAEGELAVNANDLDLESLLRRVIHKHTEIILKTFQAQLQRGPTFSAPGEVKLVMDDGAFALRAHLCADELVIVTIDPRTGRLTLRDTGDLAAAGRGPRFSAISDRLNETPQILPDALVRLRFSTITDLAEQKANYLGLQSYRIRNFTKEEMQKLGPAARGMLYIRLSNFPSHYLVLVITDEEFRFALISAKVLTETMFQDMIMEDIAWLDVRRIHKEEVVISQHGPELQNTNSGQKRKREIHDEGGRDAGEEPTRLETQVLRELYAYCCARVAYTKIEQQLKTRAIPYTHVNPTGGIPAELFHTQSSLTRSIPALCVQSSVILNNAPAAEAAMPNIRIIPLNWWSNQPAQVVTCVKLKYVQQPIGKRAGTSTVIRPSKRIIYDTTQAIVSFLSDDVDKCVDEFRQEWARVSKMVVIAREVAQMSQDQNWSDVRLLSFDLQTVEFAYSGEYAVSITCTEQLSEAATDGSYDMPYDLRFSRIRLDSALTKTKEFEESEYNPHDDVEPFMRKLLQHGKLGSSLHKLVALLRDTLPVVVELEDIRVSAEKRSENIDTFAKAAGWFRILFGDQRHALDFRLLAGSRVAILDGSHTLFHVNEVATNAHRPHAQLAAPRDNTHILQPIPDFPALIVGALNEITEQGFGMKVTPINVGVICDTSSVRIMARTLFERVSAQVKVSL